MNTMQTRTHDEESALRGVRRNAIDRDICQLTRFILTEQILAGFRRCECDAAASYSGSRFIIITAAISSGASCTTSVEYGYGSDNAVTDSVSNVEAVCGLYVSDSLTDQLRVRLTESAETKFATCFTKTVCSVQISFSLRI